MVCAFCFLYLRHQIELWNGRSDETNRSCHFRQLGHSPEGPPPGGGCER